MSSDCSLFPTFSSSEPEPPQHPSSLAGLVRAVASHPGRPRGVPGASHRSLPPSRRIRNVFLYPVGILEPLISVPLPLRFRPALSDHLQGSARALRRARQPSTVGQVNCPSHKIPCGYQKAHRSSDICYLAQSLQGSVRNQGATRSGGIIVRRQNRPRRNCVHLHLRSERFSQDLSQSQYPPFRHTVGQIARERALPAPVAELNDFPHTTLTHGTPQK